MAASPRLPTLAARLALACAILLTSLGPGPPHAHAQDIPGRRLPDIHILTKFHDGYWDWYDDYLERRDEERQRISEIRMQLGVIAMERKRLRAEWLRLLYLEHQLTPASDYDPRWSPFWEAMIGVTSLGELASEGRREIDDILTRWSGGMWNAPLVPDDVSGRQLEASYQRDRDDRRSSINAWKEKQRELIDEALAANRRLAARCAAQQERSGQRRPWLNAEAQRLDDELIVLELYLYDAAQWFLPDELPALVAALDLDRTGTEEVAALFRAKVHLATAAWNDEKTWLQMTSPRQAPPDPKWIAEARRPRLEAIAALRRVLELNPDHAEARGMLIGAEMWWLREIAAKLDVERRASLDAFRQYLSARGFYPDQPAGWSEDLFEIGAAFWGLGPIALVAGLPGLDVPGARATQLDTTQTLAARNQVALLTIMRLVKNGVLLHEIPSLSTDRLAERLTLHTADAQPLPPDRARRLLLDVRDTFADLADLRRLASTDTAYLADDVNEAFAKVYYAPLDPTYTLYESVGDLLNVHNIAFLWGPGSIVKIDGKWQGASYLSPTVIEGAERAGTLVTGRQAFVSALGLDALAETLASTKVGRRWAEVVASDRAARATLGVPHLTHVPGASMFSPGTAAAAQSVVATLDPVVDAGFRLGSAMVLYAGAGYLAEQAGIPGGAILVELLGEIGPAELVGDVIRRSGASTSAVASRLDTMADVLRSQRRELAQSQSLLSEVSGLADELRRTAVSPARQATIQRRLGEIATETRNVARTRQAGSLLEPVDRTTIAAAEVLQKGDIQEGVAAVTGGARAAERAGRRLDAAIDRAGVARARLAAAAQPTPIEMVSPERPKTIAEIINDGPPERFWQPTLYQSTGPGRSLQLGDEAIRRGDLRTATEHFRRAKKQASENLASYGPQLAHANQRLELVVNAGRVGPELGHLRRTRPASPATRAIDDRSAAEAFEQLDLDFMAGTVSSSGGANPVHLTRDTAGNVYYVKRIAPTPGNPLTEHLTRADVDRILATEAASSSLARAVGLDVPAARYDARRRVLITRAVAADGAGAGRLMDMPEHVALAVKRDYAQQRVFRAWIGDSDGHAGNMLIGNDGRLYLIDFDQAVLSGTTSRQIVGTAGQSEAEMLEMTVSIWSYVGQNPDQAMYRWVARFDQTITYADARDTVDAIKKLAADPDALRRLLTEAGYQDVEGAMKSLTERAGLLEKMLQPLLDGGLLTRGVAWRRTIPRPPIAHLAWPRPPHCMSHADRSRVAATAPADVLPRAA
jgi:hypothetical protein